MRYFLVGFMGTGKSYWGKLWAKASGISYYDLDEEIEKAEGKTITDIFKENGEGYFRKKEKQVLSSFFKKDNFILSCGGGTPCFFNNMKKMNQKGVTIYLKTGIDELVKRLSAEKQIRPLIGNVEDDLLKDFILQRLKEREPFYSKAIYHFNTAFLSEENFKKIASQHE
ncbi:MAG TPA: shikimate kinase [Chitinophagaceae bacterium]|nr:shikimate kinase [Chitinophagaceae bacterium]